MTDPGVTLQGTAVWDNQKSTKPGFVTSGDVLGDCLPSRGSGEWVLRRVPLATGEAALENPRLVTHGATGSSPS